MSCCVEGAKAKEAVLSQNPGLISQPRIERKNLKRTLEAISNSSDVDIHIANNFFSMRSHGSCSTT